MTTELSTTNNPSPTNSSSFSELNQTAPKSLNEGLQKKATNSAASTTETATALQQAENKLSGAKKAAQAAVADVVKEHVQKHGVLDLLQKVASGELAQKNPKAQAALAKAKEISNAAEKTAKAKKIIDKASQAGLDIPADKLKKAQNLAARSKQIAEDTSLVAPIGKTKENSSFFSVDSLTALAEQVGTALMSSISGDSPATNKTEAPSSTTKSTATENNQLDTAAQTTSTDTTLTQKSNLPTNQQTPENSTQQVSTDSTRTLAQDNTQQATTESKSTWSVSSLFNTAKEKVTSMLSSAKESVVETIKPVTNIISKVKQKAGELLAPLSGLVDTAKEKLSAAWDWTKENIIEPVKETISTGINWVKDNLTSLYTTVKENIWDPIAKVASTIYNGVTNFFSGDSYDSFSESLTNELYNPLSVSNPLPSQSIFYAGGDPEPGSIQAFLQQRSGSTVSGEVAELLKLICSDGVPMAAKEQAIQKAMKQLPMTHVLAALSKLQDEKTPVQSPMEREVAQTKKDIDALLTKWVVDLHPHELIAQLHRNTDYVNNFNIAQTPTLGAALDSLNMPAVTQHKRHKVS